MAVQISGSQIKTGAISPSNLNLTAGNYHFGSSISLQWAGSAVNNNDF